MREIGQAVVLGAGASGWAAARLLRMRGTRVTLIDAADTVTMPNWAASDEGLTLITGCTDLPEPLCDLGVVSPGIPATSAWIAALQARGVPVWSELELAARCTSIPMIAVTGSNGKSTLVKLLTDALNADGQRAVACGNYGRPLSDLVCSDETPDWAVVEVSSFQLEWVAQFRPQVAVLLNVQPDHLDRHGSMEAYTALKLRLFGCQEAEHLALLPFGFSSGSAAVGARVLDFGSQAGAQWRWVPGAIEGHSLDGDGVNITLAGGYFDNPVLGCAAAAAAAVLSHCGVDTDTVSMAFADFEPLPHRMQPVGEINGVRFIDDSKATNLAALTAGLAMTPGPVRLIAGGRLKEARLVEAKELLTLKVKKVYLIGESTEVLKSEWSDVIECRECGTLEHAVALAIQDARAGETVLLSPGCASFDQFNNYAHRGDVFRELIQTRRAAR